MFNIYQYFHLLQYFSISVILEPHCAYLIYLFSALNINYFAFSSYELNAQLCEMFSEYINYAYAMLSDCQGDFMTTA